MAGPDGGERPVHSGSYGVGVSRLAGAIIEASHDEAGLMGRGLWLANQVCDLVQVRSFDGVSTVRIHKRRA